MVESQISFLQLHNTGEKKEKKHKKKTEMKKKKCKRPRVDLGAAVAFHV
jgi:pyruvate-formate lyase-activating enzyme